MGNPCLGRREDDGFYAKSEVPGGIARRRTSLFAKHASILQTLEDMRKNRRIGWTWLSLATALSFSAVGCSSADKKADGNQPGRADSGEFVKIRKTKLQELRQQASQAKEEEEQPGRIAETPPPPGRTPADPIGAALQPGTSSCACSCSALPIPEGTAARPNG